ncbi:class I SAM-dependent methyltransferase [Halovivax limisalsi]|uniref:class I SAM-dependent methyltransferase n=1 Tax=Halovivax limisalsi TaxID=1453760 RepID=UPI001FFD988B|nr:class I SAM-dependent methyltransferase [Halovivax limisalsi]
MPTEATIYRVLLAMPDDVEEERPIAKDVVIDWNSTNGRKEDIHLQPISATHIDLESNSLADDIDAVLGTFWTTIEDPRIGGTSLAETVRRLSLEGETPSIIGFSEQNIPTHQLDPEEYTAVQQFKEECRNTGYFTYATLEEYESRLKRSLSLLMEELLADPRRQHITKTEHEGPSEYDVEVDHDRLQLSAEIHRDQDVRNIDRMVDRLEAQGLEPPYRVLDAGCGYGTVTQCRFGDDSRFDVVAIDQSRAALSIAREEYAASNVEYRWLDVNNLPEADLGTFDLVFAAYLFHHLQNQESVLSLLWEAVREGGCLLVRSCEDGQHLHYPPDEDMEWIVDLTDDIPGSSDRTHGRRLPTHMKRLTPEPTDVWLDLENYHTVGMSSSERREYWEVFHSNRLHYAKTRAEREDATVEEKRLYERMAEAMASVEQKIAGNEHVFDAKSVPVSVAVK